VLRIYECLEQPTLSSWQLIDEIDIASAAPGPSPTLTRAQTAALATPTQTHSATLDSASASLVAQALQQNLQQSASVPISRTTLGNREADGGWTLSWCKDRYWGEIIAAGAGNNGVVKVIQLNSRRSNVLLSLEAPSGPSNPPNPLFAPQEPAPQNQQNSYAVVSVAWAPSCGRSYHLLATGSRDGHVRIWKLKPPPDDAAEDEEDKWTAVSVGDFDQHKSAVGRVEWNITGCVS